MKLEILSEVEFDKFSSKHEQATFLQTVAWAKLKSHNGWKYDYIGLKDGKKIIAGTLLLSKSTPIKKKMFYVPRGFLLDYDDEKLLTSFTNLISEYVKENNGFFIKIDPYIMYHERNRDGEIIEGGVNNQHIVDSLRNLGFVEQASKVGEQSLQAKWMYWIKLSDKTLEEIENDMTSKTRQMIRKNEKNGVVIREGGYEDLEEFKKIMDHTSERREFLSRDLKYYQDMYSAFGNGDKLKLIFADLLIEDNLNDFKNEFKKIKSEYEKLIEDIESGKKKMSENKLKLKADEISRLEDKIKKYEDMYSKYGKKVTIGAIFYFLCGKEVLSFIGGAYDKFLEYQPFYTIHYEMIKYAKNNNYEYYNFYGLSSDLSEKDPMYGVYQFKKGFGGEVVELIGEYDLKLSPIYYLYKVAYYVVHKLKKIKAKLQKKSD